MLDILGQIVTKRARPINGGILNFDLCNLEK
jgi:hypothetical protein